MADNVGYTPGSGATVAADEIGGVLYQRVKPVFGDDGAAVDVSATNPLPVELVGVDDASPLPVAAVGELIEAIEAMRYAIQSLTRSGGSGDARCRWPTACERRTGGPDGVDRCGSDLGNGDDGGDVDEPDADRRPRRCRADPGADAPRRRQPAPQRERDLRQGRWQRRTATARFST